MKICFQRNKRGIYSLACPEVKLRALAADQETKLLTASCRQAIKYAKEGLPAEVPQWFDKRFKEFCKNETKDRGDAFMKKSDKQKLLLFSEDQKGKHPFINFSASGYDTSEVTDKKTKTKKKGPWRKQKYVHLSGLVAIDLDNVDDAMAIYKRWEEKVDFKALKIYLIYLTPRMGLRVVFRCEASRGNLIDNQLWMCKQLCVDGIEVEPDGSCKDSSRGSFLTSDENFLYDNLKELYEDEPDKDFIEKYEPEYRAGRSASVKTAAVAAKAAPQGAGNERTVDVSASRLSEAHGEISGDSSTTLGMTKWRGYDIQGIINQRYADKLPCEHDKNRHTESLKLATDLMVMLDGDKALVQRIVEAQPWVQEIIEGRNENVAQTVESAAQQMSKREGDTSQPYPSKAMQEAIEKVAGMSYKQLLATKAADGMKPEDAMVKQLEAWGGEIRALWDVFPLLKDVCAGLKPTQYPAALFTAGGILMTLMTRCWYRFYHKPQKERRLNCSLFVIGHPASGKSMADDLYKILAEPMVEADKAGKKALNDYKNSTKKKAANKEGKDKPKVTIRIHPARTANGQFITDMINAKENVNGKEIQLHMFTFDTELDNSITLQSGGSWINKLSMELKAFHNEEDGQMYMNLDSPIDSFDVTWNFIYTGTPIALKKKVTEKNFGSGLSTRLAVLPMPKTNFEMLDYEDEEHVDWERLKRMKDWAFKLDKRTGLLPVKPLVRHLWEWTKNRMADCAEDNSEANELMLKRVAYHGLNYAAPFVDMRHWSSLHQDGNYWTGEYEVDETDWKLCELIARIQYATQQHFFGVMAEKYFDDMNNDVQVSGKRHHQKSVEGFNRLPEIFTREDVMKCFGYKNENGVNSKIKRLVEDKMIEVSELFVEDGHQHFKYKKIGRI